MILKSLYQCQKQATEINDKTYDYLNMHVRATKNDILVASRHPHDFEAGRTFTTIEDP
jgi:hypothetical protein